MKCMFNANSIDLIGKTMKFDFIIDCSNNRIYCSWKSNQIINLPSPKLHSQHSTIRNLCTCFTHIPSWQLSISLILIIHIVVVERAYFKCIAEEIRRTRSARPGTTYKAQTLTYFHICLRDGRI